MKTNSMGLAGPLSENIPGTIPTEISSIRFTFVAEENRLKAREILYMSFIDAPNLSLSKSIWERYEQGECNCFIIPCESSLGPLWPIHNVAASIVGLVISRYFHQRKDF
jgi:hypothetical protein